MISSRRTIDNGSVAAHYDRLDFFHRDVWGEHLHHGYWESRRESVEEATRNLSLKAIGSLKLRPGGRVIDIGCGYGATSRMLAEEFRSVVSGYTLSEVQREWAVRNQGGTGIDVHREDWLCNREPSGSADAMISIECVSHVADKAAFFAEISRVLKPGGRCVVCCWLAKEGVSHWVRHRLLEPVCKEGRMPGIGTAADYRKRVAGAGLEMERCEEISRNVRRTWRLICGRVFKKILTKREYRKLLFRPSRRDRARAMAILRVMAAYYGGWMKYGFLVMRKPINGNASSKDPRSSE